ncbi:MAG: rRNA pseudouridine synthase [Desulfuromonadales bacterium]|jgi:23S rRNA pseudouridine2605 synthase|nr:rRNA pseudouridine synthase [Desulfuromonadales bacterium]
MEQRLQKLIAASGFCSRREAETLIAAGRVGIDGRVAVLGERGDPDVNSITIDDKPLSRAEPHCYLLMHKPVGVVTTNRDPEGRPIVADLLDDVQARVFPVGRLDYNTSGLLLLTNDGELANQLAHPRHEVDKTYLVRVRGRLRREDRQRLEQGVPLDDGLTAPARVQRVRSRGSHTWFEIIIHEGRNRQVRRMCEKLGYPVSRLARISYDFLTLGELEPGRYRHLTADEVNRLKKT